MIKIAFLSRYQNQINRGAESFVTELSLRLSKAYSVDVLSGNQSDSLSKILSGGYDVVISMNGGIQALKASFGRNFSKYKLLIAGQAGIGRGSIWNIAVVQPDIFVALTDDMASWAKKWAWGSRIVKIPNGVDLDKFSPNGPKIKIDLPKPIILSVGALVWYKYHERVIRAIREMGYGSVLIVGEGPEKQSLEKLGRELLGKRFKIINFPYEQMPKVYRSVDLFTLASWDREAFGIVYLEAMACGLGVVAPDDSVRSEIIGEAGILVDVSDPVKYAQAIGNALKLDLRNKAIKQARKFSWERIGKLYEQEFKKLLN